MSEQRRYIRFDVLLDAICHTKGALKRFKINNFSKNGVGILCSDSFKKGEEVTVEMIIPGDNIPILFEGEVAWSSEAVAKNGHQKCGIKFKNIKNDDKSRVLEHIYQRWIVPNKEKK